MHDNEQVTRGDLPHWYKPGYAHFVTYRLTASIPTSRLRKWRAERDEALKRPIPAGLTAAEHRERVHKIFFARYDKFLDSYDQRQWLARPAVAEIIRENLYHHHGRLYELIAWCLMPNHVHIVIQPLETGPLQGDGGDCTELGLPARSDVAGPLHPPGFHSDEIADSRSVLSRIMHSLKSYTANRANEVLRRSGRFWERESYDHWIRDLDELHAIIDYIRFNPVRAGLCLEPQLWEYSSAYERFHQDGSLCGAVSWLRDDWRR